MTHFTHWLIDLPKQLLQPILIMHLVWNLVLVIDGLECLLISRHPLILATGMTFRDWRTLSTESGDCLKEIRPGK